MDDYTREHDADISPSDLSVDDILAEFQQDVFSDSDSAEAEKPTPILVTAPVSEEDARPEPADPAAWADSITVSGPETQPLSVPEKDVEEFLNPEDDGDYLEDSIPYSGRERTPRAPARGGLFSFLGRKKAAPRAPLDLGSAEEDFDARSDPAPQAEPDDAPRGRTANERPVPASAHSGSLGRMEREARSYIAQLQAESGAPSRRERDGVSSHAVDLDTLLGIDAEGARLERPAVQDAEEGLAAAARDGYDGDTDYDYEEDASFAPDADPTQYSEDTESYRPDYEREEEIDSRFNLGGQKQREQMTYGGSAVDLSADEDYVPAAPTGYNPSQWTPDYDDPLAERSDEIEEPRKKHRFLFGRARQEAVRRERAEAEELEREAEETAGPYTEAPAKPPVTYGFDDEDAAPADYAPQADYDAGDEDFPEEDEDDLRESRAKYHQSDLYVPPTFREYLLSLLASFWLRLRGTARGKTAETMPDTVEDLGPELSPAEASKYYGSLLRSMKLRLRIAAVLLVILCYVSLEAPIPGMLKTLPVMAMFCFGLQAAIMLLALDVVTTGIMNIFRLRIGADTLAVFACLFTGLDALNVALSESAALHMPLCAVSSGSIVGLLLAATLSARGLRKAIRVPAIGKHFYAVTAEEKLAQGEITLLKSLRSARGFVHRAEEAGPDETLYNKISLPLLGLSLILTVIVMIVKKSYAEFLYILSAMLVMTVPFGAMLSFSFPFFLGSNRIFKFGAAIAGWSGLCDIGASKNLIVTDRDLFPESAITIESVRIFADEDAQKVISYAGTMMDASGCCSAGCFRDLMKETNSPLRGVDGFEFMPGGGMKGIIDGHVVLCGSTDLMRLMNVRIPFRLTDKTTVLLAIDGILYGIFALKYEGLPAIRTALLNLMRSARPPVFAVRDFNINPEMLHNVFDLATDGYDFPPFADRFKLSEPEQDIRNERITAILCNEGLPPLTSTADVGRSMYMAVRANVWINLLAAVLGVLMVFIRLVGAGACPFSALLFYGVFWTLLVLAVSAFVAARR